MKRLICLIMMLFVFPVVSVAEGSTNEIVFRGIPWESSIDQVADSLRQQGIPVPDYSLEYDGLMDPWSLDFYQSYMKSVDHAGCRIDVHSMNVPFSDDFRMGGYLVKSIHAYCHFAYSADSVNRDATNSRFYMADAWIDTADEAAAYDDLKDKLSTLYGEPVEDIANQTAYNYKNEIHYSVWYGANNTAVCLRYGFSANKEEEWVTDTEYLILTYGKTDSEARLCELKQAIAQEETTAYAGDLGGL